MLHYPMPNLVSHVQTFDHTTTIDHYFDKRNDISTDTRDLRSAFELIQSSQHLDIVVIEYSISVQAG